MELYGRSAGRNGSDRPAEWVPAGPQTGIEESVRRLGFWNSEILYPERPGEPDCAYFMRNGTCGYGIKCRYNHPRDRSSGVQPCAFYLQNGYCKFGHTCKFDHPMGTGRYSPSASSLTDMSVAPYMVGPSLATMAPSFSYSELRPEFISGSNPHSSRMPSSGNTSSSSVGLIFSQTGSASLSDVQLSSQSTAPLSISTISTRQGGEVRRTS
ncbi:hypothetical protein CsSME_00040031 [Camellia sinensis var. sinensis]